MEQFFYWIPKLFRDFKVIFMAACGNWKTSKQHTFNTVE